MAGEGQVVGTASGTAGGAVIGSSFGPAGTYIGAGVGGMLGGMVGGMFDGDPEQDAALAQQQVAQQALQWQMANAGERRTAVEVKPGDIQTLNNMIALREQAYMRNVSFLEQQQKLLDSINPAIAEAGQQALSLLQGKDSAIVSSMSRGFEQRRKNLEATLNQRGMKAGSSSWNEAMTMFDVQAEDQMIQTRTTIASQLLGQAISAKPNMGAELGQFVSNVGGMDEQIFKSRRSFGQDTATALSASPDLSSVIQTAGARYTGAIRSQQFGQQLTGQVLGAGLQYGMTSSLQKQQDEKFATMLKSYSNSGNTPSTLENTIEVP